MTCMTHDEHDTFVTDTPDGISHFQFARCIAALKIEVSTGMSMSRGSILKLVQTNYGITGRTKAKALEQMLEIYEQKFGREYGSDS